MSVKLILTDIEGTTSSISFVKDVLFPYAAEHLPAFIKAHQQDDTVRQLLADTAELAAQEGNNISAADMDAVSAVLLQWIAEDKKATPLKTLQGMIW
ncbi:MAG: acireductone synthase, partial [Oceanospirillaceae bacterium]|nr:acireductone synthase [Oceanospirillaceae bacterium]